MTDRQKHIMISGGRRGLGRHLVEQALQDGWFVSTFSRSAIDDLEHKNLFSSQLDLTDETGVEAFFKKACTAAEDRPLFALINNAGIAGEGILATFPSIDTHRIINTNLIGAITLARLATRVMLRNKPDVGGRIINISSIIGQSGYTGLSAYSASKAGLDGFTRSLAREVGRRNITVNSIAPGYLETDMSDTLESRQRDQIIRRTPLGRLGTVEDVWPLVDFLLGDGGRFITGQTITVDGGINC